MEKMPSLLVKQALLTLLNSLFLLIIPSLSFSQNLIWSQPIEVASGVSASLRPRVALDNQDNPIVIFAQNANPNQLYKTKFNNNAFEPIVNLATAAPYVSSAAGPEIAFANDIIYLSFENENEGVYMLKSINGGNTFSDTVRVDNVHNKAVLPNVNIKSDFNPLLSFTRVNSSWTQINQVVSNSIDGGQTFLPDVSASVITSNQPCECCFSKVVSEGSTQASIFRNNDNNVRNFYASVSHDGGQSFSDYLEIDLLDWNLNACPDAGPDAYLKNGKLFITYRSGSLGPNRVFVARVDLNSLSVEQVTPVDEALSSSMAQKYPDIAGDESNVGVVWMDNRSMLNDCFFSYSTDGFDSWSTPVYISDSSLMVQFVEPDVAYRNNKFHFVYRNQNQNIILYRTAELQNTSSLHEVVFNLEINDSKIQLPEHLNYQLFDVSGKLIQNGFESTLDISGLSKGLYLLKTPTSVHKFVKE